MHNILQLLDFLKEIIILFLGVLCMQWRITEYLIIIFFAMWGTDVELVFMLFNKFFDFDLRVLGHCGNTE